jgi:hypothetical protein
MPWVTGSVGVGLEHGWVPDYGVVGNLDRRDLS